MTFESLKLFDASLNPKKVGEFCGFPVYVDPLMRPDEIRLSNGREVVVMKIAKEEQG